jgi:hypothetical protein
MSESRNNEQDKGVTPFPPPLAARITPHDTCNQHLQPIWGITSHKRCQPTNGDLLGNVVKCISNSSRTECRHCDHASQRRGEPLKSKQFCTTHKLTENHLSDPIQWCPPPSRRPMRHSTPPLPTFALSGWLHKLALQPLIATTSLELGRGAEGSSTTPIPKLRYLT